MTFDKLLNRVYLGVQRDDLKPDYPDFINEACKEIQKMRNWSWMHRLDNVVMQPGQTEVYLPDGFKTFEGKPPVFLLSSPSLNNPYNLNRKCIVVHRSEFMRQYQSYSPYGYLNRRVIPEFPLWYDTIDDRPVMGCLTNDLGVLNFSVSYYKWLPKLQNPGDENYLSLHEPLLVIAKAKSIALSSINDPLAMGFEQEYMTRLKPAMDDDELLRMANLRVRIGG